MSDNKTEVIKRLPCNLCEHYDSDANKCDIGNDMEEDNDNVQGCWDFLP